METNNVQKVVTSTAVIATALAQTGLVAIPIVGPVLLATNILSALLPSIFRKKKKTLVMPEVQ